MNQQDTIQTIDVEKTFPSSIPITQKVSTLMKMFGVDIQRLNDGINHKCKFKIKPGQICFITGPSGSGKSVLLSEISKSFPETSIADLSRITLADDRSVIDSFNGQTLDTLSYLNKAGLNDVFTILNKPSLLSDGQKYRYRLAKALNSKEKIVIADEFCTSLDRITAGIVAGNIRRLADKTNKSFILASAHDDILADLKPDILIIKHLSGNAQVIYKTPNSN